MPSELDDRHLEENKTENITPSSEHRVPPNVVSEGPFADLPPWPLYSETEAKAPGDESRGETYEADGSPSVTPSASMRSLPPLVRLHSHLPTPYSPNNPSSYLHTTAQASESSTHILPSSPSTLPTEIRSYSSPSPPPPFRSQNILTPESSPLAMRSRGNGVHFTIHLGKMDGQDFPMDVTSQAKSTPPAESTAEQNFPSDAVSRPVTPGKPGEATLFVRVGTPSSNSQHMLGQKPSIGAHDDAASPSVFQNSFSLGSSDEAGGEIRRIRAQLMENQLAFAREAEARRPDYLKRTKRLAPNAELSIPSDGSRVGSPQLSSNIGVTESPVKGRRLTLFQETSDESFEESLMAGGYGRYRSGWPSWRPAENEGPHRDSSAVEGVTAMSEQEIKKQSRLAAFRNAPQASSSKMRLYPVEMEGRGRVLMDFNPLESQSLPKPSPSKAKRSRKKKKTSTDVTEPDNSIVLQAATIDGPNWPDSQFPWRLQSLLQDGYSHIEQEERMRCIESFLDRDSDSDDIEDDPSSPNRDHVGQTSPNIRAGGGKMCPLASHSQDYESGSIGTVPSDPADARTALLSKRSIRAFSLKCLRKRNMNGEGEEGETVCICNGRDDGRELVQCDACRTWYHLECIGIRNTSELGREEDPWFCANCAEVKTPPPVAMPLSEPIFVPTEEINVDDGYDPPFFQAGFNPSPATPWTRSMRPPMTPPRTQPGPYFSSGSSWDEPSSHVGPHTPQYPSSRDVQVSTTTPGGVESLSVDGSPFDPTSTPSRGIKLGAAFATPKTGLWAGRAQELFHTPTRPGEGVPRRRHMTHHGSARVVEEETPTLSFSSHSLAQGFTPIGRNLDGSGRLLESPLTGKRPRRTADVRLLASQERAS